MPGPISTLLISLVGVLAAGAGPAQAAPGDLDRSFGISGKQTTDFGGSEQGRDVAIQTDGRIVVVGSSNQGAADFALARYNPDGSLDTSFSGDGRQTTDFGTTSDRSDAVAIQGDGKIVVAGSSDQGATSNDIALARYNPDGSLDTSFSGDGRQTTDFSGSGEGGHAVAIQGDGKVVIAGSSDTGTDPNLELDIALARYNPDGSLDTSFSGDGRQTTDFGKSDYGEAVALQGDGKIVVAGLSYQGATNNDFILARYSPDGSLDSSFSGDGKQTTDFGSGDEGHAVAIQTDGKIVVAGYSYQGAMSEDFGLARYNPDGSLDSSFSGDGKQTTDFGGSVDFAEAVALQGDGKIVVGGSSDQGAMSDDFGLARYNPDGSLDSSFSGDGKQTTDFGGKDDPALAVALQGDGKIVVAGYTDLGALDPSGRGLALAGRAPPLGRAAQRVRPGKAPLAVLARRRFCLGAGTDPRGGQAKLRHAHPPGGRRAAARHAANAASYWGVERIYQQPTWTPSDAQCAAPSVVRNLPRGDWVEVRNSTKLGTATDSARAP